MPPVQVTAGSGTTVVVPVFTAEIPIELRIPASYGISSGAGLNELLLAAPDEEARVLEEIRAARRPRNWDLMGGRAVRKKAVEAAIRFVRAAVAHGIPLPDRVTPSAKGAVALRWGRPGKVLYVEVASDDPDGTYYECLRRPGDHESGRGGQEEVLGRAQAVLGSL